MLDSCDIRDHNILVIVEITAGATGEERKERRVERSRFSSEITWEDIPGIFMTFCSVLCLKMILQKTLVKM